MVMAINNMDKMNITMPESPEDTAIRVEIYFLGN